MNRFMKSTLVVGALLSTVGVSCIAPAQADNRQERYLNNMAVQMYANNVARGMNPLTGGVYSPYVNGAIYNNNNNNNWRRHRRHRRNYDNYNYYNNNYGYAPYGYGTSYYGSRPSVWSQLLNGFGY